jgi:hypothetical protein
MPALRSCSTRGSGHLLVAAVLAAVVSTAIPAMSQETAAGSPSQTDWSVRLRSSLYAFQSHDQGAELDRLGGYQQVDGFLGGLAGGRLALRLGGRVADDLSLEENVHDRERVHVAYLEGRLGAARSHRVRLGRQFAQEGPNSLRLDGAWIDLRPARRWQIHAWGGAQTPASFEVEAGDSDDALLGARLVGQPFRQLEAAASWGYREAHGAVAARPLGLELTARPCPCLRALAQGSYDLETEAWDRLHTLGQWRPSPHAPSLTLQYLDRRPRIDAGSYFARFTEDVERIRIARATTRYETPEGFGAEVEYFGSFLDERRRLRASVPRCSGRSCASGTPPGSETPERRAAGTATSTSGRSPGSRCRAGRPFPPTRS